MLQTATLSVGVEWSSEWGYFNFMVIDLEDEIWAQLDFLPPYIFISNFGRVKRIAHQWNNKGDSIRKIGESILPQYIVRGYKYVGISTNGESKLYRVHRLVALAFIPNPENKPTVNHVNEIKFDNRVVNLEWATHSEQILHGGITVGAKNGRSKLSESQVLEIRMSNVSSPKLSKQFNVSTTVINSIKNKKSWKHI